MTCPWCGALSEGAAPTKCPRCGAVYVKAAALAAGLPATAISEPLQVAGGAAQTGGRDEKAATQPAAPSRLALERVLSDQPEHRFEYRLRVWALPSSLLLAVLFHASATGHFLQRVFFTMLVHEFGHATTAWFCGFAALPTLWRTSIADTRGLLTPLLLGAGIASFAARSIRARQIGLIALAAVLGLAQLVGTLALSPTSAQALIAFGGDAGAMVIGSALMTAFYFGEDTPLRRGQLRWGFLVIGAAAYVDTFATWWAARHDWDAIPFGEIEGVGLSDASKLTGEYAWSVQMLIDRYVGLGYVCGTAIVSIWIWGVVSHGRTPK